MCACCSYINKILDAKTHKDNVHVCIGVNGLILAQRVTIVKCIIGG